MLRAVLGLFLLTLAIGCSNQSETAMVPFELSKHDADVVVKIDGQRVEFMGARPALSLTVGEHVLEIEGDDYERVRRSFEVVAGSNDLVRVELVPKRVTSQLGNLALSLEQPTDEIAVGQGEAADELISVPDDPPSSVESELNGSQPIASESQPLNQPDAAALAELTPRELEVIKWARQSKSAEVITADGFGLVFPVKFEWSEHDFDRFRDLPHLHTLGFAGYQIDAASLSDRHILRLLGLPKLDRFQAQGDRITDRSLEHLAKFPIRRLTLIETQITDEGLSYFSRHQLFNLHLPSNPMIGDAGMARLDLSKINVLNVADTPVTDRCIELLNPHLRQLNISFTKVTGAVLERFKEGNQLNQFLADGVPIEDRALFKLKQHQGLRNLNISRSKVSAIGLQYVAETFPDLRSLGAVGLEIATREVIDWSQLQQLEYLGFSGNGVGDVQLRSFTSMKRLKDLKISTEPVYLSATQQGLLAFKQALPNCKINGKTVDELNRELAAQGR